MTLFFNWISLVKETKGNPSKTVAVLQDLANNNPLKYGLRVKLKGTSFLLNAKGILNDKSTDILYVYQYLLLAARRDYSFYSLYGTATLPLSYYPDIDLSSVKTNPLLNVTNTEIYFKYEETNGTKF